MTNGGLEKDKVTQEFRCFQLHFSIGAINLNGQSYSFVHSSHRALGIQNYISMSDYTYMDEMQSVICSPLYSLSLQGEDESWIKVTIRKAFLILQYMLTR